MRVLTLNAGSSTLKWALLEGRDQSTTQEGDDAWQPGDEARRAEQMRSTLRRVPSFDAVGHRVVHGGSLFTQAIRIDAGARRALGSLVQLDPQHMGPALAGIDAVTDLFPSAPQVAAFDTAFHAQLPPAAAAYALPFEWTERWGLRRFGFHGLSVAYSLRRARERLGHTPARLIVCHLGGGCSVTALLDGRSFDTTMGFSPLEGVVMATRSGSVDPGLLLYLLEQCGVGVEELRDTLETRSGLLGVSGVSGDLRQVLAAADAGQRRAQLAYDQLIWILRRAIGAMAGALGGVDALVFTGGIGENSERVRTAAALALPGLQLDPVENRSTPEDRCISAAASTVCAWVIHAREDLMVLAETLRLCPGP